MSRALEVATIIWMVGGIAGATAVFIAGSDRKSTPALVCAWLGFALFFPLIALGCVLYGLYRAPRFLWTGISELREEYLPKRIRVPRAKVVDR